MDIANAIVTLLVGSVAILVYGLSKRAERRNAATIIIMDIRHAEQVVMSVLEKDRIDRSMRRIIMENNWVKYKHLFASTFSSDDFSAFNRFFYACVEIAESRERMMSVFEENVRAKSQFIQNEILSIEDPSSSEGQQKRHDIIKQVEAEIYVFEPNEPKLRIRHNLQMMGRLSTTVAFDKLRKIAGRNA